MAIAFGLAAVLARPAEAGHVTCRIGGWSVDPAGLTVRAAPLASARRLARLPRFVRNDDGDYGPGFDILEARNGWLRIARVTDVFRPTEVPPRRVFAGTGWVDGRAVRVAAQSGTGHAAPDSGAAVVVSLGEDGLAGAEGAVQAVLGCRGGWALLRYRLPAATRARGARAGEAWFSGICPDQRTTCSATPSP